METKRRFATNLIQLTALTCLAFIQLAGGVATASEPLQCPALLAGTIDERYKQLKAGAQTDLEYHAGVTVLLNETFSPILRKLSELVLNEDPGKLRNIKTRLRPALAPRKANRHVDFKTRYEEAIKVDVEHHGAYFADEVELSVTPSNRQTMEKLGRVLSIFTSRYKDYVRQELNKVESYRESPLLLKENSFTENDLAKALSYAVTSVAQAASQLTAEPIEGYSTDRLFRAIMTQEGPHPSLMVQYSLMLPPELLGAHGYQSYFHHALESGENGKLKFSPEFRVFLKEKRASFAKEPTHQDYEHGRGCPVGRCMQGAERPALQDFLDTLMYIYSIEP